MKAQVLSIGFLLLSFFSKALDAKTQLSVAIGEGLWAQYSEKLLQEIFMPLEIEVVQKNVLWFEALSLLENGTLDCVVGVDPMNTPEAVFPEESIGSYSYEMFKRAEDPWIYQKLSSLKGRTIGAQKHLSYDGDAVDAYLAGKSDPVKVLWNKEVDIAGLLSKKIDVLIAEPIALEKELQRRSLLGFVQSAGRLTAVKPVYFACNTTREAGEVFVRLFDMRLRVLRRSGRLEEVMQQYGLSDWSLRAS